MIRSSDFAASSITSLNSQACRADTREAQYRQKDSQLREFHESGRLAVKICRSAYILSRRSRARSWCWDRSRRWSRPWCNAWRDARSRSWRRRRCWRCARRSCRCWCSGRGRRTAGAVIESHVRAERAILGARRRRVDRANIAVYRRPGIH